MHGPTRLRSSGSEWSIFPAGIRNAWNRDSGVVEMGGAPFYGLVSFPPHGGGLEDASSTMIRVEHETRIAASRERIWEILTDHEGMPRWFPAREVIRRRPGTPDPNGVDAVRVVRASGLAIEERVTAFEPGKRMEYVVTGGVPLRDHRGVVVLEAGDSDDESSVVRWSVELRPLIPGTGWILRRATDGLIKDGLDGLRRFAEAR